MSLLSRKTKQNIEDETLAAFLTEAYDARLNGITSGSASEAFPSRGRRPSAHTGADEVVPADTFALTQAESAAAQTCHCEPEADATRAANSPTQSPNPPVPVRVTSVRRARWTAAIAAVLAAALLGTGGWLLNRSLRREPALSPPASISGETGADSSCNASSEPDLSPKNCHPADLGGETVWILDDENAEYAGEYDLQKVNTDSDFYRPILDGTVEDMMPEGFAQKTVMSYADYAAYCETWGLDRKYDDPAQSYLVLTVSGFSDIPVRLIDVMRDADTALVFLYSEYGSAGINRYEAHERLYDVRIIPRSQDLVVLHPQELVLTVPVDRTVESVETPRVMSEEEYEKEQEAAAQRRRQTWKNVLQTLPDGTVTIVGYASVSVVRVNEQFAPGLPEEFEVCLSDETVCIWTEDTELLNPDETPYAPEWSVIAPAGVYVCIRAEGCTRIEDRGLFGELTDDFPDYKAARLIVCCDEDPDKAFAAVCKPLDAAFNALSLTEIQDRVRNPETYRDELRSEDWAGCVHKSALFDYGAGYLYAIWDTYDKHLYGAWLFDRNLTLRETVVGHAVELPSDGELEQILQSLTTKEAEAEYGEFLYDSGSGAYLPTWFTSDGRLIVVNATGLPSFVSSEDVLAPVR